MRTIKLVAIDMDGTLLNTDKTLSQVNIEALNEGIASNIQVVICTGRPLKGIEPYLEQIHLTDQDFIISNNGASIMTGVHHQIVYEAALTMDDIDEILNHLPKIDSGVVLANDQAYRSIASQVGEVMTWDANLVNTPIVATSLSTLSREEPYYKILIGHDKEVLDHFYRAIPEYLFESYYIVRSQDHLIEIQKKDVHKGTAFNWLSRYLNISLNETAAIGDGNNDIEMIEAAGIGIAMGNATDQVKAVSDYEVTTNDRFGVSEAIDYLMAYNQKLEKIDRMEEKHHDLEK